MFWNQLRLAPVSSRLGAAAHYIGIIRDVTAQIDAAAALQRSADLDQLTSIANRTQFVIASTISSTDRAPRSCSLPKST